MEQLSPEMHRIFAAKEARRKKLAALPFPEKVRIIVQLQRMVAPILRARSECLPLGDRGNNRLIDKNAANFSPPFKGSHHCALADWVRGCERNRW
jgi:hypothetical protein